MSSGKNSIILIACAGLVSALLASTATATTITTVASTQVSLGSTISDTATLSDATEPTGTVTFRLYGPNNASCGGSPVFTSTSDVSNGTATSASFTPSAAGTYRWMASYSGDANNASVNGACNDPNETTEVAREQPTITTTGSPSITLNGQLSDSATVRGFFTGNLGVVTFRLYGPDNTNCSGTPVFQSQNVTSVGGLTVSSGSYSPYLSGVYRWIASYGGDANHNAAIGVCGEPSETVTVNKLTPTLTTTASAPVPFGDAISDTATMSGGISPTGTIAFTLYGPNDETCGAPPIFTVVKPVSGYVTPSPIFFPTAVGTYRWIASYSGDVRNNAVSGSCNDPSETVTVGLPRLLSASKQQNQITITFEGAPQDSYQIQSRSSLSSPESWTTIPGIFTADNQGRFAYTEITPDSKKFYRAMK